LCYNETKGDKKNMWILYAAGSSFFAGITAILAKCGIKKTDSDVATGASWLCYYRALQDGLASVVVPIDKLSILVTIIFSRIVFGERLNKKSLIGLGLIVAGTILLSLIS
jgi:transporter family protein